MILFDLGQQRTQETIRNGKTGGGKSRCEIAFLKAVARGDYYDIGKVGISQLSNRATACGVWRCLLIVQMAVTSATNEF